MKFLPTFVFTCLLACHLAAGAQPASADGANGADVAVSAAARWLAQADAGDGAASWQQAAPAFQAALDQGAWTTALQRARQPFGTLVARKLKSSQFTFTLPGAPDGAYWVIQYDSAFEHKAHAVETVVAARGPDQQWRVSGYFIR